MANPLLDKVKQIAKEEVDKKVSSVKGKVTAYSNQHNYAQVEIDNPYGGGLMLLEYVPVSIVGGMHVPGPFPGDEVWVEFTAGNLGTPKVVALADRNYKRNFRENKLKHSKQGAYLPDALSRR